MCSCYQYQATTTITTRVIATATQYTHTHTHFYLLAHIYVSVGFATDLGESVACDSLTGHSGFASKYLYLSYGPNVGACGSLQTLPYGERVSKIRRTNSWNMIANTNSTTLRPFVYRRDTFRRFSARSIFGPFFGLTVAHIFSLKREYLEIGRESR